MTTPPIKGTRSKRGVLTKAQRNALTETLAADLLSVYKRMGGVKWLEAWARANETEWVKIGLSRLLPPMPKEDPDSPLVNIAFNGDPIEQARRIAFALAAGVAAREDAQAEVLAERTPYVQLQQENPAGPSIFPTGPASDPAREEWARQAAMTPEERINSESLDERCSRIASGVTSSAPAVQQKIRVPVRLRNPKNRDDLL